MLLDNLGFLGTYTAELLSLHSGMNLLDISKEFYEPFVSILIKSLLPTGQYYLIASDKVKLDMYNDRVEFNRFEKILHPTLTESNIINLPDNSIDSVVAFFTIRNAENMKMFTELKRVMKSAAKGLIIDWPMSRKDIRREMVTLVFPDKRGIDTEECLRDLTQLGFSGKEIQEKQGISVIMFWKT
jgi:ubiquinone/menaquinone biosynthesis C-methylase UbiE